MTTSLASQIGTGIGGTVTASPDFTPQFTTQAPNIDNALTQRLLLESTVSATGYQASILCADSSATTYLLECDNSAITANRLCLTQPNVQITVTANPTAYELLFQTYANGGAGTVIQSCDFGGPSAEASTAVCSLSGYIAAGGRTVELTSTVQTLMTDVPATATIPIVAGAANTAADCPASQTPSSSGYYGGPPYPGTASEANGAASQPTAAIVELVKVMLAPVAALVLL